MALILVNIDEEIKVIDQIILEKLPTQDSTTSMLGGGIEIKDNKLYLAIGTSAVPNQYEINKLAQNDNSIFGKILEIKIYKENNYYKFEKHRIIAKGSRNSQGLKFINSELYEVEHGPQGGDEININLNPDNENIENYGWPISSYGEHYDGLYREEASLHKSHKDYGFIEPIKYYAPSIAISEIISVPKSFKEEFTNDFFVSALGYKKQMEEGDRSIHHIRLSENFDKIIFQDIIPISERIRDLIFIKEQNVVLMVLESIPALGVLNIKSF